MTTALIDILLVFALVVVVPLSIRIRGCSVRQVEASVVAGTSAALSFLLPQGLPAAVLAAGWVVVPGLLIGDLGVGSLVRTRRNLAAALPVAYLLVGAGWLVLSRYGARPLGFSAQIVELTAVHFHYAGFAAPTLVARLIDWLVDRGSDGLRVSSIAYWAVLLGTPITAMGITFSAGIGAVGALLFAGGLFSASGIMIGRVVGQVSRPAGAALATSAVSVIAAMLFALSYALGQWLGTPAPTLTTMAWTHGLLNAFGFTFLGALGWILVDRELQHS